MKTKLLGEIKLKNSGTKEFPFYQILIGKVEFCATNSINNANMIIEMLSMDASQSSEKEPVLPEITDDMIEMGLSRILYEEYKNEPENREHRTTSALYHRVKGAEWYRSQIKATPQVNDRNEEMYLNMQYYMEYCQSNGYVTPKDWIEKHKHF
jgi:hypothetical protein